MPRVAHLSAVHRAEDPRLFHRECTTLAAAGFDTHLMLPHAHDEVRRGVHLHGLPRVGGRYQRVALWPRLFREARALQADLYHFHGPELIPVAFLLKQTTGARVVYDMHEDFGAGRGLEGVLLRTLERWCFSWVDHVVLSDAAYAETAVAGRAPATLVANYLQPPRPPLAAAAPRVASAPFRLVYTGVLSRSRGLMTMLRLARLAKQRGRDWRLDAAGVCYIDADRSAALRYYRAEQLQGLVEPPAWGDHVPWRTLMTRAARADVGLALLAPHPNFEQVIPTKFYEYLHCGLPILCSDFPRWRAFVERHDCGAVVPPGDAPAAFDVLDQWARDPARYRALSANARAAAPQYEWPVMGRRLVRCYNRLLGPRRPLPEAPSAGAQSAAARCISG